MRKIFLMNFLIIITLAIFQSMLINLNLVLITLVILAFVFDSKSLLFLTFLSGITFDLLTGSLLGQNGFIFLTLVFLVLIYKDLVIGVEGQKGGAKNLPIFLFGLFLAILLSQILNNLLNQAPFLRLDIFRMLIELVLGLIAFPIIWYLNAKFSQSSSLLPEFKRN